MSLLVSGHPNRYTIKQQQNMITQLKSGQYSSENRETGTRSPVPPKAGHFSYESTRHRRPSEAWCGQTTGIIELSNAQRTHSKAMRNLSTKESEVARTRISTLNKEVNEKLQKKVAEAAALASKLRQCADSLQAETDRLVEGRNSISELLQSLLRPIRKCDRRKSVRAQRPPRENIQDLVETAIVQERQELQNATQLLTEHLHKCDRQIEIMRKVYTDIDEDVKDKQAAIQVDKECLNLMATESTKSLPKLMPSDSLHSHHSHTIGHASDGVPQWTKSSRQPTQWKESSNVQMSRAKDLINESLDLRSSGSVLSKKVRDAQQTACAFVDDSLRKKVMATTNLHQKLSKQRLQLNSEMERLLEQRQVVLQEINDISGPIEIASRRLELRRTRPSREQVRDAVEEALEGEYATLRGTSNRLHAKLDRLEREIAALTSAHKQVTEDLEGKSHALELDQVCLETSSTRSSVSLPPMTPPSRASSSGSRLNARSGL